MKKIYIKTTTIFTIVFLLGTSLPVDAGNEDRAGQAGASELLINPWARSSGWCGLNTAAVRGIEGIFLNPAGMAFTNQTEAIFSHTQWLQGTDININTFGLSQSIGDNGSVLGLGIMSMNFGDIDRTEVNHPEGGIGTFSPNYTNIGISYSRAFSNSIYGGINVRIISESLDNISAQGIALDAGLQYVTGPKENIKFGVAMKNVGPRMMFSGDGLVIRVDPSGAEEYESSVAQRASEFELPSLIHIGAAYDILLDEKVETNDEGEEHTKHSYRVTLAGNFTSNSFTADQYGAGVEVALWETVMVRGGYKYEAVEDEEMASSALTGIGFGMTVVAPINKEKGSTLGFDYSYRDSNPFSGTHSFGIRINL